jgi:CarboxypepD_reg-like domain
MLRRFIYIVPFFLMAMLFVQSAAAQYKIMGTVYDSSRNYPLEAVSVMSTSGRGTITNADGVYQIEVSEKDSIWFSYLGKPTVKFPVLKISNPAGFDISLQVSITVLKEVKVKQRNYKQDSLQNRNDYAKIFNYQKPKLKAVTPQYGAAAGFDLDEIINMFRFKRNRSMLSFQKRLLLEEREKFITHRFNKALVRRLTPLDGQPLDSFMILFRPSYQFTQTSGDYDFQLYIKTAYARFQKGLLPEAWLRIEEDDE